MKKMLLAVSLLILSNCQNNTNSTIKIGVNAEYPPYEYIENGQLTGFNIDGQNLKLGAVIHVQYTVDFLEWLFLK